MVQLSDLILGFNSIPNMYTIKHKIRSCSASCGHDATGPKGGVCTGHLPGTTRHACRSHTSVWVDWLGRWLDSPPQDHCFEGIQHQQWWGCLSAAPYPTQQATGPAPGPEVATSWFLETMCGQKVCLGACLDGRTTLEWALSNLGHVMGLCV